MKNIETKHKIFVPTLAVDYIKASDYKRKDDLYSILHTVYSKQQNYRNKIELDYSLVEIPFTTFMKLFSDKTNLSKALKFLKEHDMLTTNEHYFNGGDNAFAKKYKIGATFLSSLIEIEIQDKNINKKMTLIKEDMKTFKERALMFSHTNYHKNFRIDHVAASEYLLDQAVTKLNVLNINHQLGLTKKQIEEIIKCKGDYKRNRILFIGVRNEFNKIINVYTSAQSKVMSIKNDFLFFNRNKTNGRLDTNLTNLPTELRQFLTAKELLFNIDIKNSQPFFLYCLLKQESNISNEELERYGKLVVDGGFYEYLLQQYEQTFNVTKERKFIKGLLFKIFFSKIGSFAKQKEFFASVFPEIMVYINKVNQDSNKILANKLTTVESTAIISIILPELGKLGIKPFTIHDSFVCNESEVETIISVFNNRISEMYGICPSLHVKTLLEDSNTNTEVEELDEELNAELEAMTFEEFLDSSYMN